MQEDAPKIAKDAAPTGTQTLLRGLNHTQTTKQCLGASRRGVLGDFLGVFLHIQPLPLSE